MLRACGRPVAENRNQNDLEGRFKKLEEKLDAIATGFTSQEAQTWASVAAAAPAARTLPIAQRTAVRVRIADAEGKTPAELVAAINRRYKEHTQLVPSKVGT